MFKQLGFTVRGLTLALAAVGAIAPVTARGAGSDGQQLAELQ